MGPVTASDGIHDTLVTDDSIRMLPPSPPARPVGDGIHRSSYAGHARQCSAGEKGCGPAARAGACTPRHMRADRLARILQLGSDTRHDWRDRGMSAEGGATETKAAPPSTIKVFLADDNLLVREGVRALLALQPDFEIVGVAADYDELVTGAEAAEPHVVVTDIRMPPTFQREGIDAAKEVRKRHPGTGVVVLSQYDEPEYAIALLEEGAAGYAYLLKDRVADGDRLVRAVREVATGGSMLDPEIVQALVAPVRTDGDLT